MIFGSKREAESQPTPVAADIYQLGGGTEFLLEGATAILQPQVIAAGAKLVVAVSQSGTVLDQLLERVSSLRDAAGAPVVVVCFKLEELSSIGDFLHRAAVAERLSGVRLILYQEYAEIRAQLAEKSQPFQSPNCIKMPLAPEIENSGFKYFYMFSPELRAVVNKMKELAQNKIERIYLLGGPGIGKTSLAYYYFLSRAKGNFVTVNLNAESTGDKAAMKSLLCGHVTGAIAGGGSREGALSFARDGVCFLDESHGVTGVVMQVLMEALDSGQYLPFGATAKRRVECSVIFASNRSWDALREMMHLDEHARLGATIVSISDLRKREEDLIAQAAAILASFAKNCTTWQAPTGFTPEAWKLIQSCPWRGNSRTLIRVVETAAVSNALKRGGTLIPVDPVAEAISLWEPAEHPSAKLYASY
jgi:transcriptional regulator with AAA-type ATPase domain